MYCALCEAAARTSESPGRLRRCAPSKGPHPLRRFAAIPAPSLERYTRSATITFQRGKIEHCTPDRLPDTPGKRSFYVQNSESKEVNSMKKSREQLEKERDEAIAKREQYQHRQRRLENRVRCYTEGERKKRSHRLITRGAAVESVAPEVRSMSERDFFLLMEKVFSLPEVAALVSHAADQQKGG